MDDGNIVSVVTLHQVFVLALFLVVPYGHAQPAPAVSRQFTGTVVAIHDGDTISVRAGRETIRIRLEGIDCPEYRQPYSARAKQFTAELVHRKDVTVDGRGDDQYGRLLARVRVGDVEVNETLVRNGLAWHYQRREIDPALAAAERSARAARIGLWADPNPVPPWRWRRDHPR
jgi:endonuclease YncB( thermonuclease family)